MDLLRHQKFSIRQKRELAELVGFETRNKYEIATDQGEVIGYAAEQGRGFLGLVVRQFLGHWRSFEIRFFNAQREPLFTAAHPFRWIFQRMNIYNAEGEYVAGLQQRFSILSKKFDVEDARGKVVLQVSSPFWKIWTFSFKDHSGKEGALIRKKWSGLLKEAFTDTDNFTLSIENPNLGAPERQALLAAAIFVDLQYFEKKANS
ncbi:MAG: hypothetical protein KDD61_18385 [Bdellovibrionales bacterium]|nr:hypothetical protein [Bdellovibrionales bacterium]